MGDDPGTIEPGYYTVADGVVTLTDRDGKPVASGRMQLDYTSKVGDNESEMQVAQRLTWRRYRATKGGTNFNRCTTRDRALHEYEKAAGIFALRLPG